ncbi:MAG: glutamine-hydrolyzing carbamoyl-phosphate synthase small subunit [Candidatus Nanopelagicales bacterium]|nr:glutamine-hydrolyzing carbamoyl-phosphate synthase small subunit [Candidatus Nanopelagicales bacterium]
MDRQPAVLVLEDGREFAGRSFGALGSTLGEAVFATGMTGYQETLTDPSYHRQIVVQTAPHIGNTGMNAQDPESRAIWVAGYVIREPSPLASSWRASSELEPDLISAGVVGICGVDTRALTRHLRDRGAMRAGIFSGDESGGVGRLDRVLACPSMVGADLSGEVTTSEPYVVEAVGERRFTVAAVDLGIKTMTPRRLAERGVRVLVLPAGVTAADLMATEADGYFFSNGPGDPAAADHAVELARALLAADHPVFGICFGHQVFGRALGLGTFKLPFGHRGINQPVRDHFTGRVEITAHNHGFAISAPEGDFDTPFGPARVSHSCLNDGVVEGLRLNSGRSFSVQYHPEAAAGPHDAAYLFDRFCDVMGGSPDAFA